VVFGVILSLLGTSATARADDTPPKDEKLRAELLGRAG
jgi:hypothetical protein